MPAAPIAPCGPIPSLFFGPGRDKPISQAAQVRDQLNPNKRYQYRAGYSMAAAAQCWVAAAGSLPPGIATQVGTDRLVAAHFEYPLPAWGGGITMTDVMAFLPDTVIAVEAKVQEPFGPLVQDWVGQRAEHAASVVNRTAVIDRYAAAFQVEAEVLMPLRYQLLHRTLAAAMAAKAKGYPRAWMVVQHFLAPEPNPATRKDFERYAACVPAPTIEGVRVRLAWADEAMPTA